MTITHPLRVLSVLLTVLLVNAELRADEVSVPVDQLMQQMESDDWMLQAEAMTLLVHADRALATRLLREITVDQRKTVWFRGRALIILAELEPQIALTPALELVKSNDRHLRADALAALGEIGGASAVAIIDRHLRETDPVLRATAITALAKQDPSRAWPILDAVLPQADDRTRPILAAALPYINNSRARSLSGGLLNHADAEVRRSVIRSLGRRTDELSLRLLMQAAGNDPLDANRRIAQRALLAMEEGSRIRLIQAGLLNDNEAEAKAAVALLIASPIEALMEDVAVAMPALEKAGVAAPALRMLAAHQPDRHVNIFRKYLSHESSAMRGAAVEGMGAVASVDHWRELSPLLSDSNDSTRVRLVEILREAGRPESGILPYVRDQVSDQVRRNRREIPNLMALYLTTQELPEAIKVLRAELLHGNRQINSNARRAINNAITDENAWVVAGSFGYLYDWRVIGPFLNDEENAGHKRVYPPEEKQDFTAEYEGADGHTARWRDHRVANADGWVPLHSLMPLPAHQRVAYVYTVINAPSDQSLDLRVEYDQSAIVWLNGEKVGEDFEKKTIQKKVKLKQGANPLLIKVANIKDYWQVRVRLSQGRDPVNWLVP